VPLPASGDGESSSPPRIRLDDYYAALPAQEKVLEGDVGTSDRFDNVETDPMPKKRKKHKAMTAEEQVASINQLSARLALFPQPAPLPPPPIAIPAPSTTDEAPVKRGRKRKSAVTDEEKLDKLMRQARRPSPKVRSTLKWRLWVLTFIEACTDISAKR